MDTIQNIQLTATNPNVRPYMLGTTLTVADVAIAKVYDMQDADAIAEHYDLSLPQVYAALAYYYDHKDEIDASIAERRQLAQEMKEKRVGSRHKPLF